MTAPVAKTKVEELLNKLQNLSEADQHNQFLLNSLQKEAEKLKNAHAYGAYIALGVVSALKGDTKKMRDYHKAAIAIAPAGDMNAAYNYAVSLHYLDFYSEAADWANSAFRGSSGPGYYQLVLRTLRDACRFGEAAELIRKMDEQINSSVKLDLNSILEFADYLKRHEVSDAQAEAMQKLAVELVREHQAAVFNMKTSILDDETSDWASVIWSIKSDERISGLNSQLSEKIAESEMPAHVVGAFNIYLRQTGVGHGDNKQGSAGVFS